VTMPIIPLEISSDPSIVPLLKNKNHTLSGYFFFGEGKVGFQLALESYRLGLEGNGDDYAALWTPLLEKISRDEKSIVEINLDNSFPIYTGELIDFSVVSSTTSPRVSCDSIAVPLIENAMIDGLWSGKAWAGASGWHCLQGNSARKYYFVSNNDHWKSLRAANEIWETNLMQRALTSQKNIVTRNVEIPAMLFYILFLLSSAFLWLAPKL
jgi:hypothetical protein